MTKEQLLKTLAECATNDDEETGHKNADEALIGFIDDPEITAAFEKITKYYS